jgi:phenylacetate-coenzyme A ligase PaaK-like adenylate-forming protein
LVINNDDIKELVFKTSADSFENNTLAVFNFQYEHNKVYRQFCDLLKVIPGKIDSIKKIPFLPIQFFKTKNIGKDAGAAEVIFESSGTTGSVNSRHFVKEVAVYEESFLKGFDIFYGDVSQYSIIGLLPSYLERSNSSLVYMVNRLIKESTDESSGFYLHDLEKLHRQLIINEEAGKKTLLIGVTYALLDFAEQVSMKLKNTIVMETGGMKGRRQEITREEAHDILKQRLGIDVVHSEYGMTELLSQAYSNGNGIFNCPPWMKILIRAEDDPFEIITAEDLRNKYKAGAINIIDLANINSCAFIATDDVGKLYPDGSFNIIGRLDNSDIRGCGLMLL